MELDLIEEEVFHFQVVDMVKIYLFLELDMSFTTHIDNKKIHISTRKRLKKRNFV